MIIQKCASVDFSGISHNLPVNVDHLISGLICGDYKVTINKRNALRIGKGINCVLGDHIFNCNVSSRVDQVADFGIIIRFGILRLT